MTTEQTPKKGRGRPAKVTVNEQDISAMKSRISHLANSLAESNKHKRQWETKCDELWAKNDEARSKNDEARSLISKLEQVIEDLDEKVKSQEGEIDNQERAYRRLSNIVKSLTESLYYSSEALNNIAGGF